MTRFVHDVEMRWSDMDAYRHINNVVYLAYLEQARVAMFFDRFTGFADGTVIARHEIDYRHPIVYGPRPLRIETWVDRVRAASFDVHYDVFDGKQCAATACTTCVTVNLATGAPRRLTEAEHLVLRDYADGADGADGAGPAAGAVQESA